jgi:anti-sigma factor RsiW
MNQELQLQLQAYLDNEVSSSEARQTAALLSKDPQAQALYEELRHTKNLLLENELEVSLPESRDFYWSKIQRAIDRLPQETPSAPKRVLRPWWLRLAVPLGAAALLAVALLSMTDGRNPSTRLSLQEVETPDEDTTSMTFFSEQQKMTVVWVQSQEN